MSTRCLFYCAMAVVATGPLFAQERFESAEAAAQALIDSAEKHDEVKLTTILGAQSTGILTSGNHAQDRAEQTEFSRLARAKHELHTDPINANRVTLLIGDEDWPFPVPIIRSSGTWSFDASETKFEMQARKIGTNELDAIEICSAYVEAQRKYATANQGQNGVSFYAIHLMSSPNHDDGLYSVVHPLVPQGLAEAAWGDSSKPAKPYHGYYFRVLDGQGPHAPGGAHSYLVKNKLMGGFGLVAWPAQYGVTGVQTFIVNQEGVVYQKDIAPPPGAMPVPIALYDPDPSWTPVE